MLSDGVNASQCSKFLSDTKLIPHRSVALTPEIASQALELYSKFGGRRRLHYFDAFHVSTAKAHDLPLHTSDKYIINNPKRLGINVVDVRELSFEKN
jgi:predicted nucleic acid-binding protein